MDRATALRLLAAIEAMTSPALNELDSASWNISQEAERKAFRTKLASAMALVSYDMTLAIVRQYPDLDPDGDRYQPVPTKSSS